MKRFAVCLLLAACAPRDPYAGQPAYPQSPAQQQSSMLAAGCAQQEHQTTMICTSILNTGKNTNSGWELRGSYDSLAKGGCPPSPELAQLDQCVSQLEAFELEDDPGAPTRRAAAKDRAVATRQQPDFKAIIDDWMRALDGKNITCRNRDVSDSDARECERWHGEMTKVEDRLSAYLVKQGYDKRDFRPLGLWPQDPDWRTSPN
jgi:hypothetical protein